MKIFEVWFWWNLFINYQSLFQFNPNNRIRVPIAYVLLVLYRNIFAVDSVFLYFSFLWGIGGNGFDS